MKKMRMVGLLRAAGAPILVFLFASVALGQGSGYVGDRNARPHQVTRSVTGWITEINQEEGTFLIYVEKEKRRYKFHIDEETKYKADKKTEFYEKEDFAFDDLKVGYTIKTMYRPDNGGLVEVRLKSTKTDENLKKLHSES